MGHPIRRLSERRHLLQRRMNNGFVMFPGIHNTAIALSEERTTNCERPLGNHQLATVLLLQLHGFIQRDNGALDFAVIRRLGGDPLQP